MMFYSLAAALLFSGATVAATPNASAASGEGKAASTIKCRNVTELGTKIPKRICRHVSDWDAIDKANQETLNDQRRNSGSHNLNSD